MITTGDVEKVVLGMPSMEVGVKFNSSLKGKTILVLSTIIEKGLTAKGEPGQLFSSIPEDSYAELTQFVNEILERSGLQKVKEQIKLLSEKKG